MKTIEATTSMLLHVSDKLENILDQTLQEQLGVGMAQYRILATFEKASSLSQCEIATLLGQTEAGVSRQIKILTSKGLLVATVEADNRRQHVCRLTPKGTRLFAAARVLFEKTAAGVLIAVKGKRQQDQFLATLKQIHGAICTAEPCLYKEGYAEI